MVEWNEENAAHLLRRAGFGAPRKAVAKYVRMGQKRAVEDVLSFKPSRSRYRGHKKELFRMQRWWLLRMIHAKKPLAEKLTLFWHGHFATSSAKVEDVDTMANQNALFRSMAKGRFRDLLLEVSRDPAMVIWLDNRSNTKKRPNENYAREIMELFTLGVFNEYGNPNYTQADVVDAARAFSGWGLDSKGNFEFHDNRHDHGTKTVLGTTGDLDGGDVVNILANGVQCSRFLTRKLWSYFAYPDPAPSVIDALSITYLANDTEIEAVLRAMFLRDEFYSAQAKDGQVSSPVEFVVGSLRNLEARTNGWDLPNWTAAMNQELFLPPNVAGWPGGLSWMTSVTRLARYEFAWAAASAREHSKYLMTDARKLLKGLPKGADAAATVDHVLAAVGPVRASAEARSLLVDYLQKDDDGNPKGFDPRDPDDVDLKVRGLVGLALTMPEAHLR